MNAAAMISLWETLIESFLGALPSWSLGQSLWLRPNPPRLGVLREKVSNTASLT